MRKGPSAPPSMSIDHLVLKRPTDHRTGDDFDVFYNDKQVGRIMLMQVPSGRVWMWSIFIEHRKTGAPYKGHEPTRDAAMKAFAEAWRAEPN